MTDLLNQAIAVTEERDDLQQEVADLKAERDSYRKALEFYADIDNWEDTFQDMGWGDYWRMPSKGEEDIGHIAREAIKEYSDD